MKILLTRNTIVNGDPHSVGEEVVTDDQSGRYLIAIGKAVEPSAEAEKAVETKAPNVAELKAALGELEVEIPKDAKKADLEALLEAAKTEAATKAAEAEKVAEAKAAEGDTVNV